MMSKKADQVVWVNRCRIARWKDDMGFGRQVLSDGSQMIGLGPLGHVRVSWGDHRVQLNQPFFKRG